MIHALRLCLIVTLMLTGIGLGVARGTILIGGQIVLCTGEGVVNRIVPGAPAQPRTHICPDMALSMMAATAALPTTVPPAPSVGRMLSVDVMPVARPAAMLDASARDPPLWFVSV